MTEPGDIGQGKTTPANKLKAFFYLAIGIAIIIFLVFETVNAVQVLIGDRTATATVVSTFDDVIEYDYGTDRQITVAGYRFTVNGKAYFGKTEVSSGSLTEGDILTIKYNAADPTKNRVKGSREILGRWFTFMLFGGFAAYLLIGTSIRKLRHRPFED